MTRRERLLESLGRLGKTRVDVLLERPSAAAGLITCLVLGVVLVLGMGVFTIPIYSDEITYRFLLGRHWVDRGLEYNLFPQCFKAGKEFASSLAFSLLRWPEALLFRAETPEIVRTFGGAVALLNLGVWLTIAGRPVGSKGIHRAWSVILVAGLVSVGVFPWMLSLARPEGVVLLLLSLATAIALKLPRSGGAPLTILLLGASACAWHPVAGLYSPVVWVAVELCLREGSGASWLERQLGRVGAVGIRCVGIVLWLALVVVALRRFGRVAACPEDPALSKVLSSYAHSPALLWTEPLQFAEGVLKSLGEFPTQLGELFFHEVYPYGWLPSLAAPVPGLAVLANVFVATVWVTGLGWFGSAFCARVRLRFMRTAECGAPFALALAWFVSSIGVAASRKVSLFYQGTLTYGAFLVVVGLLAPVAIRLNPVRAPRLLLLTVTASAVVNLSALVVLYTPRYLDFKETAGSLRGHSLSVRPRNHRDVSVRVQVLANRCGLALPPELTHLLVDDLTAWPFRTSRAPFHSFYLGRRSIYGRGILSLTAFLKERGSSGALATCSSLEGTDLVGNLTAVDPEVGLCCWNPKRVSVKKLEKSSPKAAQSDNLKREDE